MKFRSTIAPIRFFNCERFICLFDDVFTLLLGLKMFVVCINQRKGFNQPKALRFTPIACFTFEKTIFLRAGISRLGPFSRVSTAAWGMLFDNSRKRKRSSSNYLRVGVACLLRNRCRDWVSRCVMKFGTQIGLTPGATERFTRLPDLTESVKIKATNSRKTIKKGASLTSHHHVESLFLSFTIQYYDYWCCSGSALDAVSEAAVHT